MNDPRRIAQLHTLLRAQWNFVTTVQLLALGYTYNAIRRLVDRGQLHKFHQGLYSSAAATCLNGWRMAAVLVCGDGACLSHSSAAALWGVCRLAADEVPPRDPIHITTSSRRSTADFVVVHRGSPPDMVIRHGLPVTSLPRTIVDLASVRSAQQLANVLHEAEAIDRTIARSVDLELAKRPMVAGAERLRFALELNRRGLRGTRSELEDEWDRFLDRHGIPRPDINAPMQCSFGWIEIDSIWPAADLIVELDSGWHDRRRNERDDPRRDAELAARGLVTTRVRWPDLTTHGDRTARRLRRMLAARGVT